MVSLQFQFRKNCEQSIICFSLSVAHHLSALYPNHHFRVINISLVAVDLLSFLLFHIFSFCSSLSILFPFSLPPRWEGGVARRRPRPPTTTSILSPQIDRIRSRLVSPALSSASTTFLGYFSVLRQFLISSDTYLCDRVFRRLPEDSY